MLFSDLVRLHYKYFFLFLFLLFFCTCKPSLPSQKFIPEFSSKIELDSLRKTISVVSRVKIEKPIDADFLVFNLSSNYEDIQVFGNVIKRYEIIDKGFKKAIKIDILSSNSTTEPIELEFNYSGQFEKLVNSFTLIDEDILPFPEQGMNIVLFNYALEIKTNLNLFSNGKISNTAMKGSYRINSIVPVDRVFVFFSNQPIHHNSFVVGNGINIQVSTIFEAVEDSEYISQNVAQIIDFYNSLDCGSPIENLVVFFNPSAQYSFYCRSGIISLHAVDNERTAVYVLSHEIAHHWWSKASVRNHVPDAFFNESFAEFYTYLFYQELFGKDLYEELLARKTKETQDITYKISDITFSMDGSTKQRLLYTKGALLLGALRNETGGEAFNKFLCEVQKRKISTYDEFERVTKDVLGEDAWAFFDKNFN